MTEHGMTEDQIAAAAVVAVIGMTNSLVDHQRKTGEIKMLDAMTRSEITTTATTAIWILAAIITDLEGSARREVEVLLAGIGLEALVAISS